MTTESELLVSLRWPLPRPAQKIIDESRKAGRVECVSRLLDAQMPPPVLHAGRRHRRQHHPFACPTTSIAPSAVRSRTCRAVCAEERKIMAKQTPMTEAELKRPGGSRVVAQVERELKLR